MTIWSSARVRKELGSIIDPADESRIKHSAYELGLGQEACLSGSNERKMLNCGEPLWIKPGQIAALTTEEIVSIPVETLAFISMKFSATSPGLINISGFHVDPGFKGRLVFTVYNAGTEACVVRRGEPLFLIWFADRSEADDPYDGRHKNQSRIPNEVLAQISTETASPAALDKRIGKLEVLTKVYGAIFVTVLVLLFGMALSWLDKRTEVQKPQSASDADVTTPSGTKTNEQGQ